MPARSSVFSAVTASPSHCRRCCCAACRSPRSPPSGSVTAIRRLDASCEGGLEAKPSTGIALGNAAWFVVTGAVIVFFCWFLPRRHRRRVAARESAVPSGPSAPPPLQEIDDGDPVEVDVVDVRELRRFDD